MSIHPLSALAEAHRADLLREAATYRRHVVRRDRPAAARRAAPFRAAGRAPEPCPTC